MGFEARVVADSVSESGKRLTTMVWKYPRFIHSEVMTHRMLSRNAASSRAIPVKKMIEQVLTDPARPVYWGKNKPGMQAREELSGEALIEAKLAWSAARHDAIHMVEKMMAVDLHKQIANRILEPWMWMTTIVSATDWANVFALRRHPDAQPEFKHLADMAYEALCSHRPELLRVGQWHLPFILAGEFAQYNEDYEILRKLSTARCARVSYLNHDGTEPNAEKDFDLHDKLIVAPHASPFEHVATPAEGRHANFTGWMQYRQMIPNENVTTYPGL